MGVNGNPVCARPPGKIGEYAELGNVTRASVKADEEEFVKVLKKRAEDAGGMVKVTEVSKKESEVKVEEVMSLHEVIEGLKEKFPGLTHNRIPVCNSAAPLEPDFDTLCGALLGTNVNCPVIVNCQVGLSRSTTGCVCACLFREFQLSASYEGLIETVPGVNLELLRMDKYEVDPNKDTLFRGEFEVVKELIAAVADGDGAKRECDKVICEEGKGKLQWERDIPQEALDNLQNLANSDFKKNLGKIIHDIYLTGHNLFKDMPQGDHKKRAKYRFASKTLMRILPAELKGEVEGLIAGKTMTLDLYEILGQCTWGQGKSL